MSKPRVRIRNGKLLFAIQDSKPNTLLIAHYEKLLGRAKSGEMISSIEIVEWRGGHVSHGHSLDIAAEESRMLAELVATVIDLGFSRTRHADRLYGEDYDHSS